MERALPSPPPLSKAGLLKGLFPTNTKKILSKLIISLSLVRVLEGSGALEGVCTTECRAEGEELERRLEERPPQAGPLGTPQTPDGAQTPAQSPPGRPLSIPHPRGH